MRADKPKAAPQAPPETAAEAEPKAQAPQAPEDYYDQLLRLKAEFENYRKRVDREKPELYRLGKANVLLKLLPVYDLLQRAHEQIQARHSEAEFAKGMDGIFKEFDKIFQEEGVEPMAPLGLPYDAMKHEVMGTVAKPGAADDEVAEVLQNGFMLRDKVLRTAKVRIVRKAAGQGLPSQEES